MKKLISLIIGFLVLTSFLFSKEVPVEIAKKVAINFLKKNSPQLKSTNEPLLSLLPDITPQNPFKNLKNTQFNKKYYFIFNVDDSSGFIIISGDDCTVPVLAYSDNGKINSNNLPAAFIKLLEKYKKQIKYIRANNISQTDKVKAKWQTLQMDTKYKSGNDIKSVDPLLTTTWSQSPYYNDMCPKKYFWSERAVTGCVVTAMAQIMKYHNHPYQGSGFHSYVEDDYGTLFVNFGITEYDWSNMPNWLDSYSSSTEIDAIATLMYHCGVSVEMNYDVDISGISSLEPVANALKNYFQYENTVAFVKRSDYNYSNWITLLKNELENNRPIEYGGIGSGGGHAFVLDGYSGEYFHINWGWSGQSDGNFLIDVLDPSNLGTGGGEGGYNSNQQAIIGIKQKPDTNYQLELCSSITTSSNPVYQFLSFDVNLDIVNSGLTNFNGDYCVALFNSEGTFIDYIEILENKSLTAGYHYTNGLTFHSDGLNVYPGTYQLGVFYRIFDGNWIVIKDGSYQNFINMQIESPFPENDIKLFDSIKTTPIPIVTEQSIDVWTDIANYGSTTYEGTFAVGLYDIEGNLSELIDYDSTIVLDAGYHYTNGLTFHSDNIISEPGSYMIAIIDIPKGDTMGHLIDPNNYLNPVFVNVISPPLTADIYECNDSVLVAYDLNYVFSNNQTTINTEGSNLHQAEDMDYYIVSLPTGYNYTIDARLHDSYNSDNSNLYTCDVYFAYHDGNDWSDIYDDVLDSNIVINDGGELYFAVLPYFQGETGTYLLDMNIIRNIIDSTPELIVKNDNIKLYPNPCKDKLFINSSQNIKLIEIFDVSGKKLITLKNLNTTYEKLNIKNYKPGIYFLKIFTDNEITTRRIIINE